YDFAVRGDAIAIDEPLLLALEPKFQNVARSYHPRGRCDLAVHVTRPAGAAAPNQVYSVGLRGDLAVCYDVFPVPRDRLTGTVTIRRGPAVPATAHGNWVCSLDEIRAVHAGAKVVIGGTARPTDGGTRVDLTLRGERLPLDETLAAAFAR